MQMKPLALIAAPLLVLAAAACGPNAQLQTGQQEPAAQTAETSATQTVALATQVSATASALATAQAIQIAEATATVQAASTATAVAQATATTATALAQATQQSKDIDARVQAAVAATQQAIPTATPVPPTPVVVVVPQQPPSPVYVPVPVPAPSGAAPQYIIQAINEANNAEVSAKWSLNTNDLYGHVIGRELSRSDENVQWLRNNRTRVTSTLISGYINSWNFDSPTRVTVTSNETWHFIDYDADSYTLKKDLGLRLYRNIYSIEYVSGAGWKVSLDDVPNPNGDPL